MAYTTISIPVELATELRQLTAELTYKTGRKVTMAEVIKCELPIAKETILGESMSHVS